MTHKRQVRHGVERHAFGGRHGSRIRKKNVEKKIFGIQFFEKNFYEVSKKDGRDLTSVKNSQKYGYRADNGFRVRKIHKC